MRARNTPADPSDVIRGNPFFSTSLSIPVAAAVLVGLIASSWSAPAIADDSSSRRSAVTAAGHATGQQGRKLKWLPYRPSERREDGRTAATQHLARTTSVAQVQTAQRNLARAFADPFEDLGTDRPSALLEDMVGSEVIEIPEPEPKPISDALISAPPDGEPTPAADAEAGDNSEGDLLITDQPSAEGRFNLEGKCPSPDDEDFFTPIDKLTADIAATDGDFPPECPLTNKTFDKTLRPSTWAPTTFAWKASGVCHKPLYFEDVHLERYGHSWGPYLQPIISGGHFFLTVPVLPYKMGLYPPCECVYTLGYYRPGSCAPYMLDPLPLSIRAGLAEAGVWTGMVYLIP